MRIEIKRFDRRLDTIVGIVALGVAISTSMWTYTTRNSSSIDHQASYFLLFLTTLLGSSTIFIPAPNIATIIFYSQVLSPKLVVLYGGFGWGLGEITGYIAGRIGRLVIVDTSPQFEKLWHRFRPIVIFTLACLPNPIFDVISILSGSLRVPLIEFLFATIVGRVVAASIWVGITIGFASLLGW